MLLFAVDLTAIGIIHITLKAEVVERKEESNTHSQGSSRGEPLMILMYCSTWVIDSHQGIVNPQ